jgi:reactive intermediate/imine deaminase
MSREIISTDNAPSAIGTYSQAVKSEAGHLVSADFVDQAHQVFKNIEAVAKAAGGSINDCVKLTIYLTDLGQFALVNEVMAQYFAEPYPARAAVEVSALPKGAQIESDAIMVLR